MKIALCGKPGVGKSTLCRYLWEECDWHWIRYNDILKEWFVRVANMYGDGYKDRIDVADVLENKEKYRHLLQLLGDLWGFNEGNGVDEALHEYYMRHRERSVIFDNVRFQAQFERLKADGFVLVQLQSKRTEQVSTGDALKTFNQILSGQPIKLEPKAAAHPAENQPLVPDLILNADRPVEEMAEMLMRLDGKRRKVSYVAA